MPTSTSPVFDALTIALYALVIFLPGLLTGFAAGLRGWVLAGMAPLFTYAIGGLAGPWLAAIGLPFNVLTFVIATIVFTGVAFGLRWLVTRRSRPEPDAPLWARAGHLSVLACLLFAAAVGVFTVWRGLVELDAISQGFDAVYHANAIRYIADTGDGSLFGTSLTNWYAERGGLFYPNAYHLVGTVAYQLSGATIPAIMNTNTLLLPGLLSLSLVAVVREFRGRAVMAGAVALVAIAPTAVMYQSMSRGPLLPFLLGLALTPLGTVALHRYLVRPAMDTGLVFVLAAVGLLTVHSSTLFAGIVFALPMIAQRWLSGRQWRVVGRDLLALLPIGVASMVVAAMQLFGAIGLASGDVPYWGWPSQGTTGSALGTLLSFQHDMPRPQIWLAAALFLGFVFFRKLNGLRWIGGTALVSGLLYVAVSSSNHPLVMAISRPWWDDPYRFVSMAMVPLVVIAGHGLAELATWLKDGISRWRSAPWLAPVTAVVVLAGFVGITNGLYTGANTGWVTPGYGNGPGVDKHKLPVSPDEAQAMLELEKRAKPGDWVMNDRFDGGAWVYAISGVRGVAGHYDQALPPADALLLADRFRDYATDPAVRAAVQRLNIRWVLVGQYGYPPEATRQKGLVGLDGQPFVKLVYRNADASLYQLTP
ncbi:hypothetical protein YIM_01150 [Amycolatopsis sp. YIM 10]|nr:hypothetical protein YIM_01150 [Amycolatopsis sp. YIM 10]